VPRTNNRKPAAKRIGSLEIGDRRPIETQAYEPPDSRQGAWPAGRPEPAHNKSWSPRPGTTGGQSEFDTQKHELPYPWQHRVRGHENQPHLNKPVFSSPGGTTVWDMRTRRCWAGGRAGGRAPILRSTLVFFYFSVASLIVMHRKKMSE
jgi:hypothetical protein